MSRFGYTVEREDTRPDVHLVSVSPRCRIAVLQRGGNPPVLSIRVERARGKSAQVVLPVDALDALEAGIAALRARAAKETA